MKYLSFFIPFLISSCAGNSPSGNRNSSQTPKSESGHGTNTTVEPDSMQMNREFSGYLAKFSQKKLPIVIKACNVHLNGLYEFDGVQFASYSDRESRAYGRIPSNGNYIATITLMAADCYLPILTTYTTDGKIIDKQIIAIGGCGSGCGFSCEEFMTLKSDFSFYSSDTLSAYTCDTLGEEVPGTYRYYVRYIKGKMLPNGKIQISKELEKPLKGRKPEVE